MLPAWYVVLRSGGKTRSEGERMLLMLKVERFGVVGKRDESQAGNPAAGRSTLGE